ncbi:unnamed protein product [Paramecium pentaurelia]|uniref:Uncharacterized protein n=1 Tax=Paramecium pentaurelia TaxID=43138 RepID=A0A8S1UR35_9CILI|nr:unnamed protein product [Paramecium pentaurelia]
MKKIDGNGERKLKNVEGNSTSVNYPIPLEFDSKKQHPNYLKGKSKENQISSIEQLNKTGKPVQISIDRSLEGKRFLNKQKNSQKIFFQVRNDSVSENSCCELGNSDSDCNCAKNLVPKKNLEIKINRKRKKKSDTTPFYDQIIYHDPRMRRINFVYSSSGSSESEYERILIKKEEISEKKYKEKPQKKDPSEQEIPLPEHLLECPIQPLPVVKVEKLPEVKKTKDEKPFKQPKIQKYRPKPPEEEWAKYETPNVVHPYQLKLPQKPLEKKEDSKPIYGKQRERVEFKVPKAQEQVNDFIPKALPTQAVAPLKEKKKKKKDKQNQSSSGSSYCYECECLSDACDC